MPSAEDIRALCPSEVYDDGRRIYEAGNIVEVSIDRDSVSASIYGDGDEEEEDVDISTGPGRQLYTDCTCDASFLHGQICEHIVAVLLYMNGDPVDFDLYGNVTKETVGSLLEKATPEQAMSFLAKMMASDTDMLHRFIAEHGLKSEYGISRYEGDLASLYGSADRSGGKITQGLDFGEQFAEARRARLEGKHADAARMYRALSEAISGGMGDVSDDSGYYEDCFIEALDGMVECILRERPDHDKKRGYISYLFERTASAEAGFSRHYRGALEEICSADKDLAHWQELIGGTAADWAGGDGLEEALRMQSHILGRQGRHAETAALLGGHYSLHRDICILYLRALRRASEGGGADAPGADECGRAAGGAVEAFPDDPGVLEAAYEATPDKGSEGARILERLYAITEDWNHIIRLKQVLRDWDGARSGIIERLAESSPKSAVGLCIKEDMPDKAMDVLEAAADMELLASYRTKMARRRPQRYAACYAGLLPGFAGSKSGKEHCGRVLDHLAALKGLPDGDGHYQSVLDRIRERYGGRRALMRELSGL